MKKMNQLEFVKSNITVNGFPWDGTNIKTIEDGSIAAMLGITEKTLLDHKDQKGRKRLGKLHAYVKLALEVGIPQKYMYALLSEPLNEGVEKDQDSMFSFSYILQDDTIPDPLFHTMLQLSMRVLLLQLRQEGNL